METFKLIGAILGTISFVVIFSFGIIILGAAISTPAPPDPNEYE